MSVTTQRRKIAPFVFLQASSFIGFASGSMVFMLMPWMAIELTGQATAAGLAVTITSIPGLLLSPIVGSIIDKYGRRRSAIFIELVNALVTLSIPLYALTGQINIRVFDNRHAGEICCRVWWFDREKIVDSRRGRLAEAFRSSALIRFTNRLWRPGLHWAQHWPRCALTGSETTTLSRVVAALGALSGFAGAYQSGGTSRKPR
jgi:MFS family permease